VTANPIVDRRYDFVLLFDVTDGNPNGDPDAGNLPRVDPETGHGLVTDVCLKRKIRNYVALKGQDIFIKEKSVLNATIEGAYKRLEIDLQSEKTKGGKKRKSKGEGQDEEVDQARELMCRTFYDVRAFGAVMSTGANAGQVRGPVQLTFGRSVAPIVTLEHSITRMAVATEEEATKQGGGNRTMGRKMTVPYGLYRAHGFVSPAFAQRTGFTKDDLTLLWEALEKMFEHDRSAARGLMSTRALVVFEHDSALGTAPAHKLFDMLQVKTDDDGAPARGFEQFAVTLGGANLGEELQRSVRLTRQVAPKNGTFELTAVAS
jgi:CRISPR-associated protein Csd2